MKKYDIFFAVIVCVIAGCITIWYGILAGQKAGQITVEVENEIYGTYLLSEDQEISIRKANGETNILVIESGQAFMKDATCPNRDCVHQKAISKKGETITCLPHKIVVKVTGGQTSELDAVAN